MTMEIFPISIGKYRHLPDLDDVEAEVQAIIRLFAGFGGVPVPWRVPPEGRGADAVFERRRAFMTSPHTQAVLYWVGHGWTDSVRASLAHANSPHPIGSSGVLPEELAETIHSRGRLDEDHWIIVIIDACHSDQFVRLLSAELDKRGVRSPVLLIGTSSDSTTTLGRFREHALEPVLTTTFGATTDIALASLAAELELTPDFEFHVRFLQPRRACLRRSRQVLTGAPVDVIEEVDRVLATLTDDEQRHFIPKAQGAELGEQSWYFRGRQAESEAVTTWLRTRDQGLLVVTGRAGAGKSALLGHLFVQSSPEVRHILVAHGLATASWEPQRPPDDAFDVVVHLAGMSTGEAVARLAAEADLGEPPATADLAERVSWLFAQIQTRGRLTILADALDEAVDAMTVGDALLRGLAELPGVRVVVGTRRSTHEGPDQPGTHDRNLLDALGATDDNTVTVSHDPEAINSYVTARLTNAVRRQLLPAEPDSAQNIAAVANAVARTGQEFLFARLAVHEIQAEGRLPNRNEIDDLVAASHRDLFARAVHRLSALNVTFGPILRALALSRGRGVPVQDRLAATIAASLSAGGSVQTDDVLQLMQAAAPYVIRDVEHEQTIYRLAHRTFAEGFNPEDPVHHLAVTRALIDHAADMDPAKPLNKYLTRYLSAHAGAGGQEAWQALATHPALLDRLDPLAVTADAMRTAFGFFPLPPAIAGVVGASHRLATQPADRRSLRHLAMARHTTTWNPAATEPEPLSRESWSVRWARFVPNPTHLTLSGHAGGVRAVAAVSLPDGRILLATGSEDRTVRLWDPASGHPVRELHGHTGRVRAVAAVALPDGRILLATGSEDRTVRLWDPASGHPVRELHGHTGRVRAVAAVALPDGHALLATGSDDETVRLWDPATGHPVRELPSFNDSVRALAAVALPDGRNLLAAGTEGRTVRLWDPATGHLVGVLRGHTGPVQAVAAVALPDRHTLLATGSDDETARLWDPASGHPVRKLGTYTDSVRALAAVTLPDGSTLLATGSEDRTVRLWYPGTGHLARELRSYTGRVEAVAAVALPDGHTLLATSSYDQVRMWDPGTGHLVRELNGHTGSVRTVAPVPLSDGRILLASGSEDETVRLWDPATGHLVCQLRSHTGGVGAMAAVALPNRHTLLATSSDDAVRLWDPATGQLVRQLPSYAGRVGAMAAVALPNRHTLLATSSDDEVRLWDPATGHDLNRIPIDVSVTSLTHIVGPVIGVGTTKGVAVIRLQ